MSENHVSNKCSDCGYNKKTSDKSPVVVRTGENVWKYYCSVCRQI